MSRLSHLLLLIFAAGLVAACTPQAAPVPSTPTFELMTDTPPPPSPTPVVITQAPTLNQTPVLPSPTPAPWEPAFYLIALEDAGQSGEEIGCGDSVVPVRIEADPGLELTLLSIQRLLVLNEQYYGESGLYNALYQSDLNVVSLVIENHVATLRLTGELLLGGVCDNPRVLAQLTRTLRHNPDVEAVEVFVNGVPLEELLSGQ